MRESQDAGSNVLNNRIDRVKAGTKNVKECFKELLREDEETAEMCIEDMDDSVAEAECCLDEAALWADCLDKEKDARKEAISTRPRVTYSVFQGDQLDWHRFVRDCKKVIEQFQGDQAQALTVVLGFCGPKVQVQIRKFQGKDRALDQAMQHLSVYYGISHLALPSLKESVRQLKPALNLQEVPAVCSKLMNYLESIATITDAADPLEISLAHEIFRKLYLSSSELRDLVPVLKEARISLTYVLSFVRERFITFELLKRTILQKPSSSTAGAMGQHGPVEPPKENLKDKDKNNKKKQPKCFYCEGNNMECGHKLTSCPMVGPAQQAAIAQRGRCTDCLAIKLENHTCCRTIYGTDKLKFVYCEICTCNIIFCTNQDEHTKSALPEKEEDDQEADNQEDEEEEDEAEEDQDEEEKE